MAHIIIRTVGNRQLSRRLAESYDSETHHRTAGGAVRRVRRIVRDAISWSIASGRWGHVEIEIDGERLGVLDVDHLLGGGYDAWELDGGALTRAWAAVLS